MGLFEQLSYLPSFGGGLIAIVVIFLLSLLVVNKRHGFALLFEQWYEMMYDFFSSILGEHEMVWIRSFVTNMFFVIFLYNFLGLVTDFVAPIFGYSEELGGFVLSQYVGFGTAEPHFNIAMAIVGVLISLAIQLISMPQNSIAGYKYAKHGHRGAKLLNFLYEYVPIWGKGIITLQRGKLPAVAYYPLWVLIKAFDIVISLFVGFLDIVGIFAKVISLAFRLFGNMISGTALLTVMIVGLSASTMNRFGFEFPIIAPLILVLQGLLVATIQAFVFPLLIAIFIKVARMGDEEQQATA